ncbi:MAG: UDP-glucose dehydrogenase family protein [Dehalococcoidia bacterium]
MNISVIGAGYVGLITAVGLSSKGHRVTCVDKDVHRVQMITQGIAPFPEEGLDDMVRQCVRSLGNLVATSDYARILDTDVTLVCVDTPSALDGGIDLSRIKKAVEGLSEVLRKKSDYHVVAIRSTIVPGTTSGEIIPLIEKHSAKNVGTNIGVAVNPEFLREGVALNTFLHPDRIVIGEYDHKSGDILTEISEGFTSTIVRTDLTTAEMIKYASNAFIATKISFINEIGNICKSLQVDVRQVAYGMGLDERIGHKFLNAGVGFGGSCLPKDLKALASKARQLKYEPEVLSAVLSVNDQQALKPVELLSKHVNLEHATVGVLGLAFKPGTADIREAVAIKVIGELLDRGSTVKAYDPAAVESFKELYPAVQYVAAQEVLNSDGVVILTEWEEFEHLDYKGKIVIDGRGIPNAAEARIYEGVCW